MPSYTPQMDPLFLSRKGVRAFDRGRRSDPNQLSPFWAAVGLILVSLAAIATWLVLFR